MMAERCRILGLVFIAMLDQACGSDADQACATGSERCGCYGNGTCDGELVCRSELCVRESSTDGSDASDNAGGQNGPESGAGTNTDANATDGQSETSDGAPERDAGTTGSAPCAGGSCAPKPGACITKSDGFASCAAYCNSLGETCTKCGDQEIFWWGWQAAPSAEYECEQMSVPWTREFKRCDETLTWGLSLGVVRCCCTDS